MTKPASMASADGSSTAASTPLELQVFTSPYREIRGAQGQTFSPVTSSLIYGNVDAVLVDAQFIKADIDALGDMIECTRRTLTTIFVTHGHADHYFGIDRLMHRFPSARAVATPGVVNYIESHREDDFRMYPAMFGEDAVLPTSLPSALAGDVILLEGHELRVIEVGQGDIAPSTVLHIPGLEAVITGDVAYNQIHQMLGLGGPPEWEKWIESINAIERLRPRTVIAGHKKPEASNEDAAKILDDTRSYIRDFAEAVKASSSTREIIATMQVKYPDYGNFSTLLYSANAANKMRTR